MRLICLFLLFVLLQQQGFSQTQKISISGKGLTLRQVFAEIEKQTDYTFYYKVEILGDTRKVDVNFRNIPLQQALDSLFTNQPLQYRIIEKNIVVSYVKPANPRQVVPLSGYVTNRDGQPLPGASVVVRNSTASAITDEQGRFAIKASAGATVAASFVGHITKEVPVTDETIATGMTIRLQVSDQKLEEVTVVSTGYQKISKERATGSFVQINNELLNRSVSTNIIDRLEGIASGLTFNRNNVAGTNTSAISIRGRNTIFANPNPLIVIDNFPYDGDMSSINPNDVESITILKDAAAASVWGAFSGNGVIVITTKRGKFNQAARVSVSSNVTVMDKPDLHYYPRMALTDFVDLQRWLFEKGHFNAQIAGRNGISPVLDILNKEKNNLISPDEAKRQINELRTRDELAEREKYLYRTAVNQQYNVNISGGSANNRYALSMGFDKNAASLVNVFYQRFTLNGNNTWKFLNDKLDLTTDLYFTRSRDVNNNGMLVDGAISTNPFFTFKDANGNAAIANYTQETMRPGYIDTAGAGLLLDWYARPLDEIDRGDNKTNKTEYRVNINLAYKITPGLTATAYYQYNSAFSSQKQFFSQETFFVRDLINRYSQIDYNRRTITRPIPLGGIMQTRENSYEGHLFRGQLDYKQKWGSDHELTAIAVAEIRKTDNFLVNDRQYGYNKDLAIMQPVDYLRSYPMLYNPFEQRQIPYFNSRVGNADRFISYLANASYTYADRYTFYASARQEASNLFGVETNQRTVPLWSASAGWELSRESFYRITWLPFMKLRLSYGYMGNLDRTVSAYLTADRLGMNSWGVGSGSIQNPPNPSLRWEKSRSINIGLDFATANRRIEGSIEYYSKKGIDLIAYSPMAPSTGVTLFKGNTADMRSRGIDLTLNTRNLTGALQWNTAFLFSFNKEKLTNYKAKQAAIGNYLNSGLLAPLEGRPLYSIYSYVWAGLDANGDPQGYLDGKVSKDYAAFFASQNFDNLHFHGSRYPVYFGNMLNTFAWKALSLSFNITYKFGHYFRAPSVNYGSIVNYGYSFSHPDYDLRWQKPGDELITNVPAFRYPLVSSRDEFYRSSSVLVEKGDHIRLKDARIGYTFSSVRFGNASIRSIRLFVFANNLGILWKATKQSLDPDYTTDVLPQPRSFSVGANIDF